MMQPLLFIGNLGMGELLIICLIVLLRGLGKGVRSFKEGVNNIERDIDNCAEDPKK